MTHPGRRQPAGTRHHQASHVGEPSADLPTPAQHAQSAPARPPPFVRSAENQPHRNRHGGSRVTHRPEEQPQGGAFSFVAGVREAVERAVEAADGKDVHVMGGADVIRQALAAGLIDELTIIIAPVILGGGKRLFEGFTNSMDLEHLGVRQSPYATFIDYRVKRP